MNNAKILPDDPRLTAYALNEMAPAERTEFERTLQHDPVAQKVVEEIRAAGALLADALEHEPDLAGETLAPPTGARDKYAKVVRFPYWMVSSFSFTRDSTIPFMIRSMNGRSIFTTIS